MWTTACLDRPSGILVARTRTQSVTLLGGFHGCVLVFVLDNSGAVTASTDAHTFGVDGRWIGKSDRTDVWTHQFDPAQANAAVSLGLVHTWNPDWATIFKTIRGTFSEMLRNLSERIPCEWDCTAESTEDRQSWSDVGDPWESYSEALTAADSAPAGWQDIGHANSVKSIAAVPGKLFALSTNNQLWAREPVLHEVNWNLMGLAPPKAVDLAAARGLLFAATKDKKLWMGVQANLFQAVWTEIGHANEVVAMTALGDLLYCATRNNNLWSRPPEARNIDWTRIGHANNLTTMAAANGKLFCITNDNKLWSRDAAAVDIDWMMVSDVPNTFAMAALNGKLFIATTSRLVVRDLP